MLAGCLEGNAAFCNLCLVRHRITGAIALAQLLRSLRSMTVLTTNDYTPNH